MEKQVNLTLIGIATDAVERNPRENTEAILPNRPIDLLITFASFGVTSSHAEAFPVPTLTQKSEKSPRTISGIIRATFGGRSMKCSEESPRSLGSLLEIKYGGLCGQDGF